MNITEEDIQRKAREIIQSDLHPIQVEWVQSFLRGKPARVSRRAGYTVAYRVYVALKQERGRRVQNKFQVER